MSNPSLKTRSGISLPSWRVARQPYDFKITYFVLINAKFVHIMNTTITINSLSFKHPLSQDTILYVAFSTPSSRHETLPLPYQRKTNECVYSEIFELKLNASDCIIFEVYDLVKCLVRKTYHVAELLDDQQTQRVLTLDCE